MKYFLDCEFDGFKGALLSMGIVREDGYSFYATKPVLQRCDPWVADNVVPILFDVPAKEIDVIQYRVPNFAPYLNRFFNDHGGGITIVTDWPDDVKYLCEEMITGPGTMIDIPSFTARVMRVDAYPTTLPGAVRHNAWWDAQALRYLLTGGEHQPELDF